MSNCMLVMYLMYHVAENKCTYVAEISHLHERARRASHVRAMRAHTGKQDSAAVPSCSTVAFSN